MDRSTLEKKSVGDLKEIASQLGLTGYSSMRKAELVDALLDAGRSGDAGDDGAGEDTSGDDAAERDEARRGARRRADADALIERRRRRQRGDDVDDGAGDDASDAQQDEGDDDGGSTDADDERRGGRGGGRDRGRRRGRDGGDERDDDAEVREGVLDLLPEGYGFLRTTGYLAGELDVYVSQGYVRRFALRRGDLLGGPVRFNKGNDRFPALARLETHEGLVVSNENDPKLRDRPQVDELDAVFPTRRLLAGAEHPAVALLDTLAPQGFGQRTLVTAQHGAGASALLQAVGAAVAETAPEVEVMVVLVDARPEEATWYRRTSDAEVVVSELGRPAEDHVALVELAVERATRLAEQGRDVLVLLDSLTAVGRAYAAAAAGRNQPLAADPGVLAQAKLLFGAARDLEDAGSVTMLGVLAEDTGTDVDAALRTELEGAATSRVALHPGLVVDGVPALDAARSATLREDLLVEEAELADLLELRRRIVAAGPGEALDLLG